MPTPAEHAVKSFKAVPTVDVDGNVTKWELECTYSHNGYQATHRHDFEPDTLKAQSAWTRAEVIAGFPHSQKDNVFNSQYDSAGPEAVAKAPTRNADFDIRKMA